MRLMDPQAYIQSVEDMIKYTYINIYRYMFSHVYISIYTYTPIYTCRYEFN